MRHLLIIGILILAAGLRIHSLTRHSLWLDEVYSLEASSGHGLEHLRLRGEVIPSPDLTGLQDADYVANVPTSLARDDNHPPLYFLVLRTWREIFGSGDVAIRSLSVVLSLLGIYLLYDVVSVIGGWKRGIWAALLMAVAQPQIHYAQETRGYALLIVFLLGAADVIVRMERDKCRSRLRLIVLGSCLCGMMLTHYYAAFSCLALGLYALRMEKHLRKTVLGVFAWAALAFVVLWAPGLVQQLDNVGVNNNWAVESRDGHVGKTMHRFGLATFRLFHDPMARTEVAAIFGSVLMVLPFLLGRRKPGLIMWGILLAVPLLMLTAIDLVRSTRQIEHVRYFLAAAPAAYAIVTLIDWRLSAVLVVSCCLCLQETYAFPETTRPDWRLVAQHFNAQPEDIVIFVGDDPGSDYLLLRHYKTQFPARSYFGESCLRDLNALRDRRCVWIVGEPATKVPAPDFVFATPQLPPLLEYDQRIYVSGN